MPLLPDEFEQVEQIARLIAKKEIEAMGKALEAQVKDLETKSAKLKELAEELGRQIRNLVTEQAELKRKLQKPEKPIGKGFSKK